MSGRVWMFSDQIDDEDMDFMRHEFVTYSMASDYYGLGLKPVTRMAHECGAIYKIGRKILIRRSIFEEYLLPAEKDLRCAMEKSNTRLHDENNGLDYVLVGDYYFPALILAEDSRPVGRWGRMHKRYLKEHHPVRYQVLLLSGRLNTYLADTDTQAEEQLELLTQQMAEREGMNEELKAANQMEWVRRMNSIQNRAEEVIKAELIFA